MKNIPILMGVTSDITGIRITSGAIAADGELAGVIEGTSEHQGVAAGSIIISNILDDSDIMMLISDAGDSKEFLRADGDVAKLSLGWGMTTLEIGLGGTTRLLYTAGAFAFQEATTISTSTGNLTIQPTGLIELASEIQITHGNGVRINDNIFLRMGGGSDVALTLNSAGLAADEELLNIIEGVSNHQGTAANSLIIGNRTDDSDIIMLISDGGNSLEFLRADGDVATVDLGFGMLITKFMAASTVLIEGNGTGLGFFATTPAAQPTGVAVSAAGIHAALVTLGLITA